MIDTNHQKRIDYEIIVDCYDDYEQVMGWCTYLEDNIQLPFQAKYVKNLGITSLMLGTIVEVIAIDIDEEVEYINEFEVMIEAKFKNKVYSLPLSAIKAVHSDQETKQAIMDWHYWEKKY